jgi:hypothetical protein
MCGEVFLAAKRKRTKKYRTKAAEVEYSRFKSVLKGV